MEEQRRPVPTRRRKKKKTAKRSLLIALTVFLSLVLVLLIIGTAYLESILGLINRNDELNQETMSDEEYQQMLDAMSETVGDDYTGVIHEGDVQWEDGNMIASGENIINVLLIGQDRRSVDQGRSRSDVILLCTVNKSAKTLTLTSFMRDMYVQIPGYEDNRINVPYMVGGMELLDECLKTNFGVEVDGNVEVDFYSFMGIVDMMGGIEMELTQDEADYMNMNVSWDVDDGTDKVWNMKEGVNHLTGSQALSYARMRYVGNGDFDRTDRQRKVLTKLLEKAKQLSLSEMNVILQHALPMLTTDMENSEIIGYALELFPMLPELSVNTVRIPADGTYENAYIRKMAVLLPDLQANRDLLEDLIMGNEES